MEMENEHLVYRHNEENKKQAEKVIAFVKICKKYLSKIQNINRLLEAFEQKNIKSITNNKNNIYNEVSKIINEFHSVVNDPEIEKEFLNPQFKEHKLLLNLYKLEENEAENINKIFNFIDQIGKLELNNQKLLEQNRLLNLRLTKEVVLLISISLTQYLFSL